MRVQLTLQKRVYTVRFSWGCLLEVALGVAQPGTAMSETNTDLK